MNALREAVELGYVGRVPSLLASVPAEHRRTCPLGDQCPSAEETALAADPDPTPAEESRK